MDLNDLSAFVAVAGTLSFSQAATQLHLTQPAVSKRVANLEAAVGASLFDRVARRVMLTDAGRTLLPHARRTLQDVEDGRRALSRLSEIVRGRLSIGTSHHIGLHRLPAPLNRYTARYPEVDLDLHFMDSEVACEEVLAGRLELAIVTLPLQPMPQLQQLLIWPDPLSVVVSPRHALADQAGVALRELADYPAVLPDEATYTHRIIRQAFEQAGVAPRVRLATNYMETLKMLAAIGLGWSVLPRSMLDASLVSLEIPGVSLSRRLGVVWHRGRQRSSAAQALIDELEAAGTPADAHDGPNIAPVTDHR